MFLKNALIHDNTTHVTYSTRNFMKRFNLTRNWSLKTNKYALNRGIRSLKSRNPQEFWKIIQTECKQNSNGISSLIFTGFIDHFRELNSDPRFSGYKPQSYTSLVAENDVINHPFILLEIKAAIKLLRKQ